MITEDRDFGELAFKRQAAHRGVLLLRLSSLSATARAERVAAVVAERGDQLRSTFIVVEADRLR